MVLGVPLNLISDIINKSLRISKVLPKEDFVVRLHNRSGIFVTTLVLSPFEADRVTEKWNCKWGTIHLGDIRNFEIVFILLTKVVTFYVRLTLIVFRDFSLKKALIELIPSQNWLYKCLHKFCEEFLSGKKNKRWSESLERSKNFIPISIKSSGWVLGASKFILFSRNIGRKINTKASLDSIRSWSHYNEGFEVNSFKWAGWPIGHGAFRIVKWSIYKKILGCTNWGRWLAWMEENYMQRSSDVII